MGYSFSGLWGNMDCFHSNFCFSWAFKRSEWTTRRATFGIKSVRGKNVVCFSHPRFFKGRVHYFYPKWWLNFFSSFPYSKWERRRKSNCWIPKWNSFANYSPNWNKQFQRVFFLRWWWYYLESCDRPSFLAQYGLPGFAYLFQVDKFFAFFNHCILCERREIKLNNLSVEKSGCDLESLRTSMEWTFCLFIADWNESGKTRNFLWARVPYSLGASEHHFFRWIVRNNS